MATADPQAGNSASNQLAEMAHLPPHAIESLRDVFKHHPAVKEVILYGSRAKGNCRPASDIDLTLRGEAISWEEFQAIEQAIDDLLLPWKVDLSLYHQIENESLKDHIARVGVVFWKV